MYIYNMLLRFEKKKSAIYEHDMFTVNIYFIMRISRVLCFLNTFMILNCIKVINFSSFFFRFFSVGTKQGNDSNVNLYHTIRFPYIHFTNVISFFIFMIKSCMRGILKKTKTKWNKKDEKIRSIPADFVIFFIYQY